MNDIFDSENMSPDQLRRALIAKENGWTDVRMIRVFGSPCLVLRGNKPITIHGVNCCTREDVPEYQNT